MNFRMMRRRLIYFLLIACFLETGRATSADAGRIIQADDLLAATETGDGGKSDRGDLGGLGNTIENATLRYNASMRRSEIIIEGVGFGAKPVAAPMKWTDFEEGEDGQVLAGDNVLGRDDCDGCWSDYVAFKSTGAEAPQYSCENNRPGSGKNIRCHFSTNQVVSGSSHSDSSFAWEGAKDLTDKVFVSFWVRWDWGQTTDTSYQHKLFSISSEGGLSVRPKMRLCCYQKAFRKDTYSWILSNAPDAGKVLAPNELKYGAYDVNHLW